MNSSLSTPAHTGKRFEGASVTRGGGGRGEKWFEDSYSTTTKALSALFRKKVYAALESSIAFWNEKSGWVDLAVKLVVNLKKTVLDSSIVFWNEKSRWVSGGFSLQGVV